MVSKQVAGATLWDDARASVDWQDGAALGDAGGVARTGEAAVPCSQATIASGTITSGGRAIMITSSLLAVVTGTWNDGYWFPAWGYNPAFDVYAWDGPIYAYWNLPPDQVVVNVQEALQDQGYYTGDVDGQLGNQTRDALASYQRDHDLEVTSAIDEPTVQALGLGNQES